MFKTINAVMTLCLVAGFPVSGHALDAAAKAQLLKLDPKTRLEQACDTEAMIRIKKDKNAFRPDKVIAYTFKDPSYGPNSINAPGAVFRSKGEWYHLAYKCKTDAENIGIRKLAYKIGNKIDRTKWNQYFLYD